MTLTTDLEVGAGAQAAKARPADGPVAVRMPNKSNPALTAGTGMENLPVPMSIGTSPVILPQADGHAVPRMTFF